jgi:hypothetical protein
LHKHAQRQLDALRLLPTDAEFRAWKQRQSGRRKAINAARDNRYAMTDRLLDVRPSEDDPACTMEWTENPDGSTSFCVSVTDDGFVPPPEPRKPSVLTRFVIAIALGLALLVGTWLAFGYGRWAAEQGHRRLIDGE